MDKQDEGSGNVRLGRQVRRDIPRLPFDVTRCIGTTCAKRGCCLRFLDSPTGNPTQSYSDLSTTIENGHCSYMIIIPTGNPEIWQSA